MKTININDRFKLFLAFDCDTNTSFYDVYYVLTENGIPCERFIGELDYNDVEDNLIDEDTEEYDLDGLEILCEDLL